MDFYDNPILYLQGSSDLNYLLRYNPAANDTGFLIQFVLNQVKVTLYFYTQAEVINVFAFINKLLNRCTVYKICFECFWNNDSRWIFMIIQFFIFRVHPI